MKKKTLADVYLDVAEKDQYVISRKDLFLVIEDPDIPKASYLLYLGELPKKLLKQLKKVGESKKPKRRSLFKKE